MQDSKHCKNSQASKYLIAMGDKGALSNRQMETLICIAHGLNSKETADEMGITERTVNAHVEDGMCKLGAINRPHFIAIAYTGGFIISAKETGHTTVQLLCVLALNSIIGLAIAPSVLTIDGTFTRPARRQQSTRVVRVRQGRKDMNYGSGFSL